MGKREKEETKRVRMKQSPGTTNIFKKDGMRLLLLALPFVMIVIAFFYVPLFGWLYAFIDYKPGIPLSQ